MSRYMTPAQVALETQKHKETVTAALRVGTLHGEQSMKKGRWLIEEPCVAAWISHKACAHRAALKVAA